MKSRAIALLASALLVFGLGLGSAVAQSKDKNSKKDPKTTDQQASTQGTSDSKADQQKEQINKEVDQQDAAKPELKTMGADPTKVKHDGGLDDVDAIGNRKIGDRGFGDWYSIEGEVKRGKAYAQEIEQTVKLINDPVISEYINRLGQNLARSSDSKMPITFKVIDDDSINAITLPGGFIYVNSGTILAADTEAELAGVIAHEIGHSCARHTSQAMTRGNLAQIMSVPLIFVGGGVGLAGMQAANLGGAAMFSKFSRGFETQADYLGAQYAWKAGYDPVALVTFFEKVQAQEKKKPGTIAKTFASHPQTPDRAEATQKEIATILPAKDQYIVTTSEFDDVKARLAAIENKRKITDDKDANRPSLRRSASNDKNKDGSSKDDDRPTLHRRDQ